MKCTPDLQTVLASPERASEKSNVLILSAVHLKDSVGFMREDFSDALHGSHFLLHLRISSEQMPL